MHQFTNTIILITFFLPILSTLVNLWLLFRLYHERCQINEKLFEILCTVNNLNGQNNMRFKILAGAIRALEAEAYDAGDMVKKEIEKVVLLLESAR
ncbi:hypothetical protein Hypma_001566 [Hypsizygus marmoreus]|uniref:Uncharacterized protein n=1 Tax=Hypsizygus marmoreus TaxID=39966 RepID=A0A369K0E5_HYPMA|nr:hypothetical protein Hypma_001566 [Hypsizygus marmoreus]